MTVSAEGDGQPRASAPARRKAAAQRFAVREAPRAPVAGAHPRAHAAVAGVTVSHPDKIWWPAEGIRKIDVIEYYARVAPLLRPWLTDRLLVAERCPEGIRQHCFFQRDFPDGLPRGTPKRTVFAPSTGEDVHYVVGGTVRTLLALVNLGSIALHVMNCRRDALDRPDWMAFDLDPSSGEFSDAAEAARLLRSVLDELDLVSYPKTSGGRGLHVLVPLRREASQDDVRVAAIAIAHEAVSRDPELLAVEARKAKRRGRVYIDVMRNAFAQTLPAPYSVRHRPHATVSTPLEWDEVSPRLDPKRFTVRTAERRFAASGAWDDFWRHRQRVPSLHGTPVPRRGARTR